MAGRPTANPKQFFCTECGTSYTWKQGLDTHNRKYHPKQKPVTKEAKQETQLSDLFKLYKDGIITPEALAQSLNRLAETKPSPVVPTVDIGRLVELHEQGKCDASALFPIVQPHIDALQSKIKVKKIREAMELVYKGQIYIDGDQIQYLDDGNITTGEFDAKFCSMLYEYIGNAVAKGLMNRLSEQEMESFSEQHLDTIMEMNKSITDLMADTRQVDGGIILQLIKNSFGVPLATPGAKQGSEDDK